MSAAGSTRSALPDVLDLCAAGPLAQSLLAARGKAIALDASGVKRLGGLCLQVLLSADLTWARDGQAFSIEAPSQAFRAAVADFGAAALTARFMDRSP